MVIGPTFFKNGYSHTPDPIVKVKSAQSLTTSYWESALFTQYPGDTVLGPERLTRLGNSNVLRLPVYWRAVQYIYREFVKEISNVASKILL